MRERFTNRIEVDYICTHNKGLPGGQCGRRATRINPEGWMIGWSDHLGNHIFCPEHASDAADCPQPYRDPTRDPAL